MKRRNFLQLAALSGLAVSVPSVVSQVRADEPFAGPFYVLVNASGGWDPSLMFDPTLDGSHTRLYTGFDKVGNIPFAPIPLDLAAIGLEAEPTLANHLMSNEAFLTKFGGRLTVVNGLDTTTNNHDSGSRAMWSGKLPEGYPSLGALLAATKGAAKPMAFVSSGGYDFTAGLISVTRVGATDTLLKVARPNRIDAEDSASDLYHSGATWERIGRFQRERLESRRGATRLPRIRQAMGELSLARQGDNELTRLKLPADLVEIDGANDLERFMQQSQVAVAAFKAGIAVSVNLNLGGFDTHDNHDVDQRRQQQKLLGGINYLMEYAEQEGLGDQIVVVVGSDFGRSAYNGDDGKDHHPITSALAMGPGIAGNRAVGSTTADRLPQDFEGSVIDSEALHKALRRVVGVEDAEVLAKFPLGGPDLPIFG